ncbi:MAG: AbrB/MazE/SpoVT family DNA-binding domain-containing protein [Vulcanimicrobiota bacterium]
MAKEIKIRRSGGSLSATLPKEYVEHFHILEGDRVFVTRTDEGILITPYDPNFAKAMKVYKRGARKYRDALRELAK